MIRKIFIFSFLLSISFYSQAQKLKVSGVVKDTSSVASVQHAVVSLLTVKDSVLKGFSRVNADGSYSIMNVPAGKYVLTVTHPLFADYVDDIEVKNSNETLAAIALTAKSKLLEAVIVNSGKPMRIKGDTTIYTADSFKVSANANVEELLKKMPGIQVDKNGQIKAMGVTVEKVLVDGEEFFGDDPGMAVKNLRADAVKEVQVFDKKSDQAEFTGIDDGKTQKTINLKLKEDKKKGYFGKLDAAGGLVKDIDPRYNTNLMLSSFKGKRKISGFLLNGNTGQNGMNWEEQQKFGGESDNMTVSMDEDGGIMMYRNGGSDEEPYLDAQNGYLTNVNAGVQYTNKFNEKNTFSFSPKYNSQDYTNNKQMYVQRFGRNDTTLNENSNTFTHIDRNNIKMRVTYDMKLDSVNSFKIIASKNYYHTNSIEFRAGNTRDEFDNLKNDFTRNYRVTNDKEALSTNLIFKHKFKKDRRTISVTADWRNLSTTGTNYLLADNNFYSFGTLLHTDQMRDNDKSTGTFGSRIAYTEPLGKKYSFEFAYQVSINNGKNSETTYSATVPGKYETRIDSLTNNFRQSIFQHTPSARLNYNFKKLKINAGAGIGFTDFSLKDITLGKNYDRQYSNFAPAVNLNYTYKSNHSLRISYNGNTQQPTIDQLQPLRNNNDPLNQYIGNPNLRPSFRNGFNFSHNSYNFIKDIWMYESLGFTTTSRAITTARTTDFIKGTTVSQPVNTDGNYSFYFWSGGGFKWKKPDIRIGFNPNFSSSRSSNFYNGVKSYSKTFDYGTSVSISKSKEKKYDVQLSYEPSHVKNSSGQSNTVISYWSSDINANATVYYKKVWSVISDYNYRVTQKTQQSPAFSNSLLNLTLQRTFRKDEFTAYFKVHDVMNSNTGLDRNFSNDIYTETRNDRLKRYGMIGLTWNFKNKTAAPAAPAKP